MLTEIIVAAEIFAALGIRTFVWLLIGMYAPYMPLQVFATGETLSTSVHFTQIHPAGFPTVSFLFPNGRSEVFKGRHCGNSSAARLFC